MSRRARRLWFALGIVAVAGVAIWYPLRTGNSDRPIPLVFDGTSDQLPRTVVVPTLDTAIPEGKNAVWCASFQFAWNHLKDDLAGEPVRLANAQEVADRLNRSDQTESDVEADSVYAAAGFARDGIVERIQKEMARRFPDQPKPELDVSEDGAVAYAFLTASSKFDVPFFENNERFLFKDSAGQETDVGSFGIRDKDAYAYRQLRQQVRVLYFPQEQERFFGEGPVPEFALDLCVASKPYQIVVARVDRKRTLEETLADVAKKIEGSPKDNRRSKIGPNDGLLVPNIALQVTHRFKDLEGKDKQFLNPALGGMYLDTAFQSIRFRLDRSGAELESEAKILVKPSPSFYFVNRPFLLYMKKRDAQQPFLVLWIENAELLQKR